MALANMLMVQSLMFGCAMLNDLYRPHYLSTANIEDF
jgi:hypothetical protein